VGLEDITADAVRMAIEEHDQAGLGEFCDRYGFDRFRNHVIAFGNRRYGTRVIAAAAHGLSGQVPLRPDEVADEDLVNQALKDLGFEVKQLRPPKWSREELILACSQLFSNDRVAQRATDVAVQDLAVLLQRLPIHAPQDRGHNFRSFNSVQRKLFDLMTSLPGYEKKKTRGGTLDEVIVDEFLADEIGMHRQAAAIRAEHAHVKAWALFSAEGERKYGGNTGYPDVLGSSYVYDNNVGRSLQLREGHVIVIRDGEDVLGIGRISRIEHQDNVPKRQKVCPRCKGGRFDERKVQRPRYRCRRDSCDLEFDQPDDKPTMVTQYVAYYGGTWRALDGAITADELKEACTDEAVQNAIRPLDVDKLEAMLARVAVQLPSPQAETSTAVRVKAARRAVAPSSRDDGKAPKGGRRERKTKARNGQGGFRKKLIQRYGQVCAITGRCPAEVLQAAHLRDFAEHETHNPDEGVLLRADVHLLFDNDLLAVDPTTWRVVLAPSLSDYPDYAHLDGAKFADGPCRKAITDHFIAVTATWV
jgi:hypothetical protein